MALTYHTRQSGDVTILDLTGRLSLGEEVAFGPGSGVVLGDRVREIGQEGPKENSTESCRADLRRQFRRGPVGGCADDCAQSRRRRKAAEAI